MKKLIAAIVIASMGGAFAQQIVYDYKASIKRLDLTVKFVKKSAAAVQNFKVVSDTIQGYVTLPLCASCLPANAGGIYNTDQNPEGENDLDEGYNGYAYLVLKGNKFAKLVDPARVVLKTPVYAGAAVFGSDQWTSALVASDEPIDPKKNTKAWMALDYAMPALGAIARDFDLSLYLGLGADPEDLTFIGFLGLGHMGNNGIYVQNTGFGTAKVVTSSVAAVPSLCQGIRPGETYNCTIVNTISGTLVGYPWYEGACGRTPMWDLCLSPRGKYQVANDGVISGTWNLKFNSSLSNLPVASQEDAILTKLKAAWPTRYEINENGAYLGNF